ncbi:MAG: hypothetical protein F4Z00_04620 [Acidimicrobiaceae bacterium]|nr:hypothetical protein [Acidimicrobiaceae bacterium]MXY10565.1 hypothetical protein [Acidimicrobiaceae bacterium]MXZ64818.1 hypothetical protein [Acidimicrobiaceae bacterium]MYE55497.1 hypothetical protein [Acidimicrobiaceae bacterium]MYF32273.1 hypothetical protein [Acidimicrobiaceae bacterium]
MINGHAPIIRLGIRAASPFATVLGCYLLFAGHNNPGGGFAAGLVFGAVLALRTIAGFLRPTYGITLVAAGVFIVAGVALLPLLWGDLLFDQQVLSFELPLLGKVKTGSALLFDVGVAVIVVGTVMAVLDGLGAAEFAADPPAEPDHQEQE